VHADGTRKRSITRDWGVDGFPVWSPDGRRIAFVSELFGGRGLQVMNADGSGRRTLLHGVNGSHPTWSPDGRRIAFGSSHLAEFSELYLVNADGSGLRRLAERGLAPVWSPDGQTIAFVRDFVGRSVPEIYVMNADGSGQRRVTHGGSAPGAYTWSPAA
jgi:TolB protein